jgi:hypothetical protein
LSCIRFLSAFAALSAITYFSASLIRRSARALAAGSQNMAPPCTLGSRGALCGCVRNGLERTYTEEKTVVQREVLEVVGQRQASRRRGRLSYGYSVGAALMMRGEQRGRDWLAKIALSRM